MAFFQTVQDFVAWKKQGKLLQFKPDGFDQILPNFRDADGAYMALSANALTYAYNTAKVRAEDASRAASFRIERSAVGSSERRRMAPEMNRWSPCSIFPWTSAGIAQPDSWITLIT